MAYRSPFPFLPDEHMRLVGIIAAHWEFLDLTIQMALAESMGHTHARVALLLDNMTFRSKIDLLMSYVRVAYKDKEPKRWSEFTKLSERLQKAYDLRNSFVHARWRKGKSADMPERVVTKIQGGKFTLENVPTPANDLEEATTYIAESGGKLTTFFQEVGLLTPRS